MKNLVICFDENSLLKNKKFLNESNSSILAIYNDAQKNLEKKGISYLKPEDYLKINQTEDEATIILRNITRKINSEYDLTYKGTNLPELFRIELSIHLYHRFLKKILIILGAVKSVKPEKIISYCTDELYFTIIAEVADQLKIEKEIILEKEATIEQSSVVTGRKRLFLSGLSLKILRKINPIPKKPVIFVVKDYKRIIPLIEEERRKGKAVLAITDGVKAQYALIKKRIPVRQLSDFTSKAELIQSEKIGSEKAKIWQKIRSNEKVRKEAVFENINIWKIFEPELANYYEKKIIEVISLIDVVEKLSKNSSCFVICAGAPFFERIIGLQTKIPSLILQHGFHAFVMDSDTVNSYLAVWSSKAKDYYVSNQKVKPERVIVTGQPYFDRISFDSKNIARNKLNLPLNEKIVVVATTASPLRVQNEILLRWILPFLKQYKVIIKLHYGEKIEHYSSFLKEFKNITIIKDINLDLLLRASDLLITANSTVGLEGMMQETSVLDINAAFEESEFNYIESGAAYGASNLKEAGQAIKNAIEKPKSKLIVSKFVKENAGLLDGKASERVSTLIDKLIQNNL